MYFTSARMPAPVAAWNTQRRNVTEEGSEEHGREAVEELSEAITHLAFYPGWPNAMGAAAQLKAALADA